MSPPTTALPQRAEVVVVGAGLAGLSCARLLAAAGSDVHIVDASDAVGGRVRTDEVDGFLLDRGFQVLLTAYEEVQEQVDLADLEVQPFRPGSLVWNGQGLQKMGDPFRDPGSSVATLAARVGTFGDKLKVASLRQHLLGRSAEGSFDGPDRSTQEELEALGFSSPFIDTFFRPFLGGVFLERELETSARLFRYYFRCFAAGGAVVPAGGMQRLPEQLAQPLEGRIHLGRAVDSVRPGRIETEDGAAVEADEVVLAVDGAAAASLLGGEAPDFKAAVTAYFSAEEAPTDQAFLILDGEGSGPANHVAVMSAVAPSYAPPGASLISVSGVDGAAHDPDAFPELARRQLRGWFGASVDGWTHLRTYSIRHALPRNAPGTVGALRSARLEAGLVAAGDYLEFGAIQGALRSGRRAAEAVLALR